MNFSNAMKYCAAVVMSALLFILPVSARQQELTPEQREKKMYEAIDAEVDRLTKLLNLDEGQQFYVTMTLTDCIQARDEELKSLSASGVQNTDLYQMVIDKWMDRIDSDYESYFTQDQWKKYLRSGAEKARRTRQKRREKAEREGTVTEN